ncbi:MAG: hypothetical protein AAFR61_03525 [Bacteroidota bacterium]
MKHSIISLLLLMLLGAWHPAPSGQTEAFFSWEIVQDGKVVPVKEGRVLLNKAPFSIRFHFPKPTSVLLNASLDARTYDMALRGEALSQMRGFYETGMAESPEGPRESLWLSEMAPHYWYLESADDHRFSRVEQSEKGWIVERDVKKLYQRELTRAVSWESLQGPLFLVAMKAKWAPDFSHQIEQQRAFLEIRWR